MMSLLIFFLTISALVFVHEFSHFWVAKRSGVEVEEFGFGLPPRLFGRVFRGTLYSINWLPIGGFVRLKGETGEILGFGDRGSFASAPKRSRALIIVAGVLGNLLLSFLILSFLFLVGSPRFSGRVFIDEVSQGSPSQAAGIKVGDQIAKLGDRTIEDSQDLVNYTQAHRGLLMDLTIMREGVEIPFKLTPRIEVPEGQGPLGVKLSVKGQVVYDKYSPFVAPFKAFQQVVQNVWLVFAGLYSIVRTLLSFSVPQGVTGVVGIYALTSEATQIGYRTLLQFVALISVNLAVFNILPIPALDGGRLFFIFLEAVLRRRPSARLENAVNNFGFALLMMIFVLVTISDIQRFWG